MSDLERSTDEPAPAAQASQPTPAPPASPPPQPSEDEAWAAVLAAWGDEAEHRRYLARFNDLEGLSVAGGRYKAALDRRPDDEVAQRMRAEVVKKAMVYGMAALPRTTPPAASPTVKRLRTGLALSVGSVVAWLIYKLVVMLGAGS